MLLIKVRYLMFLTNINYIKGDYTGAKKWIDEAYTIANDEKNYTFETQEDFKKHNKEIEGL
jgi:hypothetical protein